jgi:VanZ family protein
MRHAGLLLMLAVLAVLVLLPPPAVAWVLADNHRLALLVNQAQKVWPGVDLLHLLSFAGLGLLARLALPHVRLSVLFLVALLFSVVTELLQLYIPGRSALASDVRDNMLGLVLGLLAAAVLRWLWRRVSGRMG